MTGTPSTAMVAQSHHKKESPTTTSNTLPAGGVKTTSTFSPVTESSSDEEVLSLSSQNDGVKQTLLKVTPRQLSFPNKAGSSQPAAVITAPTTAVIATKKTQQEVQMEAALHLSLHNSPSLDEMDDHHSYKHLSAAGEHFARKKSEGEHISLFSRLASRVGSIGHHAHDDGYEEVRDELLQEGEGQQVAGQQVETTAVKKGVVNDDTKQLEEEADEAVSNRPSNEEEEADQPYRHLSAAGEHFAMKKAEKKAAAAAKKRAEKKSSSSTTAAPVDHSTADNHYNEEEHENDDDRYKHLSAAGEHFARKKSENGGSPMLKSVLSRMTPSFRHLHSSDDGNEDDDDEEDEAPVRNLSAAGEHFAKKKADKKAEKKEEKEDQSVEVGEEDPFKHLSSAGEHFAKKKAEKKAEKKARRASKEEVADQSAEIDEADRYKNLSSAGEHFARKKAEKKAEKKARRASKEEVAADQSVEIEEADRYKNLSSAGEHFARKKAEKKSEKAVKKVEKEEVAADQSVEIEDEDPFKHLSSAGEHFARKKAEKKARRASKEEVFVAELSNEDGEEEIDDETDRYKHLSAAGEHFARKKSDRESTSLFSRLRSSFTSQSNSTTEERDEEEEDRFKHLSSAGEHFARKKAEKKAKKKGRRVSKRENPTKREEEEEETEDPSSIVSVHSSQETDTSNEEKLCDDHDAEDADDLDLVVVVQHLGDGDKETTLTAEKDGETFEEDAENETQNLVTNTTASTISAAQSKLDETQRTPAYTLHRDLVIGKGSYGHVYIASRGETEGHFSSKPGKRKKFACKCVSLPADPKYICKLQEEVNVLRVLRGHVNVIRLFDVFVLDNELLIITELGTGGDLFHLLATHPKHGVSEEYAAKTVSDMLSAVAILHSLHICHRDLKIENWVLKSGNDLWSPLKLIDFGLSTHFTPGHKLSRVVGSSYYIAPEVLKKSYTEACDLWSLGVIVYMLLSGAPPFFGSSEELIKESILNGEYSFPQELFRDVSKDAMAFVSCLLSYDEEERYTAQQALNHPWLEAKCKPEHLLRCKASARVPEE